jgi:hypothetical protein
MCARSSSKTAEFCLWSGTGTVQSPRRPAVPESTVSAKADEPILLKNIVCDIVREGVFTMCSRRVMTTAHRDHVHLDIKRGARAIIVR